MAVFRRSPPQPQHQFSTARSDAQRYRQPSARWMPFRMLRLSYLEQALSRIKLERPWRDDPCRILLRLIRKVSPAQVTLRTG